MYVTETPYDVLCGTDHFQKQKVIKIKNVQGNKQILTFWVKR